MKTAPRIRAVEPRGSAELIVHFQNGMSKIYDCRAILSRPEFQLLKDPAFFRAVRVDVGGYGVSWNDNIDLSEYELWTRGKPIAKDRLQRMRTPSTREL